mgnify:CR=1 FL=1
MIIRYPELILSPTQSSKFALNIDLAPTIAELAGASTPPTVNGISLVPLFANPDAAWRSDFLVEHSGGNYGVRDNQSKYVELGTGEKEFYDLSIDPYELDNSINNPAYNATISQLAQRLAQLKQE